MDEMFDAVIFVVLVLLGLTLVVFVGSLTYTLIHSTL